MKVQNKFFNLLLSTKNKDKNTLRILYLLSEKSIITLIVISSILLVVFFDLLGFAIIAWFGGIVTIGFLRLAFAYMYKYHYHYFSYKNWYIIFIISTLTTAIILGLLPILAMSQLDDFNQLFIILVLVGLSAGATKTLMLDIGLSVSYLVIMLLPILLNTTSYYVFIDILLILYIFSQIVLITDVYISSVSLDNKSRKLFELKNSLLEKDNLLYHFFEEAPGAIFHYDINLQLLNYNPSFAKLFKRSSKIETLDLHTLPNTNIVKMLQASLVEGSQNYNGAYTTLLGNRLWVDMILFPFKDGNGKVLGGIGIIKDETKEHNALEKLEYLSIHDTLTGLLNRRGYAEYINNIVKDAKHSEYYSVLLYIDLNDFKSINDTLGHDVGDRVLLETSERLLSLVDNDCMVSRLGGDEFVILIPYMSTIKEKVKVMVDKHIDRIQKLLTKVFIIRNIHLDIQASIGIVIIEPLFDNIEEILRHADMSMYQAKNTKNYIAYYDSIMDKKLKSQFKLQNKLAYSIEKNQLELFFQPIVNINDDKLYSAEALIRWIHPEKGLLSPDTFIHLAIKANLLSKITWWALHEVCRQINEWKKSDIWCLDYISLNVNAQQLIENNFSEKFLKILESYDLESKDIVIEITERSLIDNFDRTQTVINRLRSHGIRCAIDDFGVGYSSLSYLKKISFHTLKIDREFIRDIESNPKELMLISSILDIAKQFNYKIVIEGVETKQQKELLLELDESLRYQGFYFSKPVNAEAFREILKKNKI